MKIISTRKAVNNGYLKPLAGKLFPVEKQQRAQNIKTLKKSTSQLTSRNVCAVHNTAWNFH